MNEEWSKVQIIAQALLDSPDGVLTYEEAIEALRLSTAKWTWASPRWHPEPAVAERR